MADKRVFVTSLCKLVISRSERSLLSVLSLSLSLSVLWSEIGSADQGEDVPQSERVERKDRFACISFIASLRELHCHGNIWHTYLPVLPYCQYYFTHSVGDTKSGLSVRPPSSLSLALNSIRIFFNPRKYPLTISRRRLPSYWEVIPIQTLFQGDKSAEISDRPQFWSEGEKLIKIVLSQPLYLSLSLSFSLSLLSIADVTESME